MEQGKDVVVKAPRTKDSSIFIFHLHLTYIWLILPFCTTWKHWPEMDISSPPVVLSGKGILKKCSKFTGEHPCRSVISIKLGVTLRYGYSSENLLHIFRTPYELEGCFWMSKRSTSGRDRNSRRTSDIVR